MAPQYPDSEPPDSGAPSVDPTALSPGTETAFAAHWKAWADLHTAATTYLEAVRHLVIMTGGDQREQLDALAAAAQEATELLGVAHAATARGAR